MFCKSPPPPTGENTLRSVPLGVFSRGKRSVNKEGMLRLQGRMAAAGSMIIEFGKNFVLDWAISATTTGFLSSPIPLVSRDLERECTNGSLADLVTSPM